MLHGDGVGELVEHPLLEGLQPLVVVAAAHKLLVLQSRAEERGGEERRRRERMGEEETARDYTGIWWRRGATAASRREGCYITASVESELPNVTSHWRSLT